MQERRKETRKNLMAYTQVFDLYGGVFTWLSQRPDLERGDDHLRQDDGRKY